MSDDRKTDPTGLAPPESLPPGVVTFGDVLLALQAMASEMAGVRTEMAVPATPDPLNVMSHHARDIEILNDGVKFHASTALKGKSPHRSQLLAEAQARLTHQQREDLRVDPLGAFLGRLRQQGELERFGQCIVTPPGV